MDFSYSYQNLVRDLVGAFTAIQQGSPTLLGLLQTGDPATQVKHEWQEHALKAAEDKISGAKLSTDVTITVVDGTKFQAGQVIAVDGSDEVMKVTAVSDNDLTVTRGFGGSTAEAIADAAIVRIIARPRLQGTNPGDDKSGKPGSEWNATQIFDRTAVISRTAEAVKKYGIDSALNFAVNDHLDALAKELNKSIIYGRRIEAAENVEGMMGGLLQFLNMSGGNVTDAGAAAITDTLLNNLLEKVVLAGGKPVTLLMNTNQARKMAALNRAASNYTVVQDSKVVGNQVFQFQGDLPMQGLVQNIVVDVNFPKDAIAMLDLSKIKLVPLTGGAWHDKDATLPGMDGAARRVIGEYTVEIKNRREAHGLIKNLSV